MPQTISVAPQQNQTQVQNPAPAQNNVQVTPPQAVTPKVEESIVTRASKFSPEKQIPTPNASDESGFNRNDIEKIADPVARKFAEDAYKSLQSGYTKKFEALASEKKQVETLRQQLESQTGQTWTPQRVQQLLNDPTFVQSAQALTSTQQAPRNNGGLTEEEYSALTPREQQMLNQQNSMLQTLASEVNVFKTEAEDTKLQTRYANYNSNAVNKLQRDLIDGNYQATREDVWKVYDYESAIDRAYKMGLQDRQFNMQEKVNGISSNGFNVTQTNEVPAKMENESSANYFKRLAMKRLAEFQSGKRA
jgi:hypothetical protein